MYECDLIVTLEITQKNIFSVACSFFRVKPVMKGKSYASQLHFSLFLASSHSGVSLLWILCASVVPFSLSLCTSLPLLHTHLRLWLLFFNSPWLSFYPLSLPFFFSFFPLSPGPLLSPSERLRIPKGADAIKMLILSVYRERERGADSMRDCGSHGELDWNGE